MSFDAESAVLGACLLDPNAYWRVADVVTADDFAEQEHRQLFTAIAELRKRGIDADAVTIGERAPSLMNLVLELANSTPSSRNARAYAESMAQRALQRRVQLAGRQISTLEGKGILAAAQQLIADCMRASMASVRRIGALFSDLQAEVTERSLIAADQLPGLTTGFPALDEMTAGLQPADLVIVAARPSVGKTALMAQIGTVSARNGKRVLDFSVEMSSRALTERYVSHIAKIDLLHLRWPSRMTDDESKRLFDANKAFDELPIFIDDKVRTVEGIAAVAHRQKATDGLDVICIDYLQLMDYPPADNTNEALAIITRSLKQLAKDLNVPVVLLSQLNRDGDERPKLSHLRGSGSIEQDADLVLLLSKPDKKRKNIVLVDVAKQRNGPTGEIYLESDLPRNTFAESDYTPASKKVEKNEGLGADDTFSGGKRRYQEHRE